MGVDPVSMFVAALVVAALVKRVPDLVAQFAEQASRGESEQDKERAERLRKAGFEPATGGAARRFFGNLWRDAWLDLNAKRQARRATRPASLDSEPDSGRSWLDRLADKVDAKVTDTTGRWRRRPDDGPAGTGIRPGDPNSGWAPPDDHGSPQWPTHPIPDTQPDDDEPPAPRNRPDDHNSPDPQCPSPNPHPPHEWRRYGVPTQCPGRTAPSRPTDADNPPDTPAGTSPGTSPQPPDRPHAFTDRGEEGAQAGDLRAARGYSPHSETPTRPATQQVRSPAVGTLDRIDPPAAAQPALGATATTVIEGEVVTEIARGGAVTGVVSGAAEARAIQRAVDEANAAYIAAMARIRARIISLGEQTLAEVQMAARSDVVQHTVQAAEAAAAAQAHAKAVGSEVGPLLGAVARAFNRRNS